MTSLNDELMSASVRVLEELCFVSPDLPPPASSSSPPAKSGEGAAVEVAFQGPARGRLEVRFVGVPLEEIAIAMLGEVEGELSEAEKRDALGEVANVICGQVLPEIGGRGAVYDLGRPTPKGAREPRAPDAFVALAALGGIVEIAIRVDQGSFGQVAR